MSWRAERRRLKRFKRLDALPHLLARLAASVARGLKAHRRLPVFAALGLLAASGVFAMTLLLGRRVALRPVFPDESAAEQELYRLLVPEGEEVPPGGLPGPATLRALKTTAYTVQKGDSISLVAQKVGLSLDTLLSWNDIRDARTLAPGTVLSIPNANGVKYKVRRGDNLAGIAKRYDIELERLLDWNDLASSVITPGQVLFLPGVRMPASDLNRILGKLFIWPLRGRLTSGFGDRPDPFSGIVRLHEGIDIKADIGTQVVASAEGRAVTGFNSVYGKFIILKHGTLQTLYAHLNRILVEPGAHVAQGSKIAESGDTGYSTGPHLHFGIYKNGEPVDPLGFLK